MSISIVIPAYNEERTIVKVLNDLRNNGYTNIIVVDDGSTDATALKASPFALVLHHIINRGMGAALATGTQYALATDAQCIVHFDADGQHRAEDIKKLIDPITSGAVDVVLGSRYLSVARIPFTKRYFIHAPARLLQYIITGVALTDVHNGLRALSRDAAIRIQITQDRMAHATEIISEIARCHLRYTEVSVTIVYYSYGQGLLGGVRILRDLIIKRFIR